MSDLPDQVGEFHRKPHPTNEHIWLSSSVAVTIERNDGRIEVKAMSRRDPFSRDILIAEADRMDEAVDEAVKWMRESKTTGDYGEFGGF